MNGIHFSKVSVGPDSAKACISQLMKYYNKNGLNGTEYYANGSGALNSLNAVVKVAELNGFRCGIQKTSFDSLKAESSLPAIVHWNRDYFVIVKKIGKDEIQIADPLKRRYGLQCG